MARLFQVTLPEGVSSLKLDSQGRATVQFTVKNVSGLGLDGRAVLVSLPHTSPPSGVVEKGWVKIDGPADRHFDRDREEVYTSKIAVPPKSPPGNYLFRLDVVSVARPDEGDSGSPISFSVAGPVPTGGPGSNWLPILLGIVLVLVVGGVVTWLVRRPGSSIAEGTQSSTGGGGTMAPSVPAVFGSAVTVQDSGGAPERPYLFLSGSDGNLWLDWWNGSRWAWSDQGVPPGQTLTGQVSALTVYDGAGAGGRAYAFGKGGDGHVWSNWWTGSRWSWSDQGLPAGGSLGPAISAIAIRDNPGSAQRPYVFAVSSGSGAHLWLDWWSGSSWQWADQGVPAGGLNGKLAATFVKNNPSAAERPCAFVLGGDSHVWGNCWSGSAWNWSDQGAPPGGLAQDTLAVLAVRDASGAQSSPNAFVIGMNGHLWTNWWDGGKWQWTDLGAPAGSSFGGPLGVVDVKDSPSAARPYVFAKGGDGHLWLDWFDGQRWSWSDQGAPPGGTVTNMIAALAVRDNPSAGERPNAFAQGSDGHLWTN